MESMEKKKFPIRRLLAVLLVLAGVGVALYPQGKAWLMKRQEKQIINEFREIVAEGPLVPEITSSAVATPPPEEVTTMVENFNDFEDEIVQWQSDEERREYLRQYMEGILSVPKIDLEMPILRGDSEFNLKVGLASLEYASKIGTGGNYCVAGHRSRTRGRQFNRLLEVEIGDIIKLTSKTNLYTYEVFDIQLVRHDAMWVTKPHAEYDSIITLITCDYRLKPTGRLVVFGKLIDMR